MRKQKNTKQESAPAPVSGSLASRTKTTPSHVPVDLVRSRSAPGQLALSPPISTDEFQPYRENDEDDFSDLFYDGTHDGRLTVFRHCNLMYCQLKGNFALI